MPKVYNWQLGREMLYPFDEPQPEKQFAAIFDTNKCIACQTCSVACKMTWTSGRGQEYMFWNNVETKPYGCHPFEWDLKLLQMLGGGKWNGNVYEGKTIFEKASEEGKNVSGFLPTLEDWSYVNAGEDECAGGVVDGGVHIDSPAHPLWFLYLPRICNHCTLPGCVANCPRKAVYKRDDIGVVLIDQSRCHGYKECVKGCPYKKSMFNTTTRRSEKCVACYPKIEKGLTTQCIEQCIGKIRLQGWINPPDKAEEDNPIDYLIHVRKVALPFFPQFGTMPNIYYIPAITVPVDFLSQIFGPGSAEAVRVYRDELPHDERLLGALLLSGSCQEIISRFDVKNGEAYGYNEAGDEIARVPITEQSVERLGFDAAHKVYRMDVT